MLNMLYTTLLKNGKQGGFGITWLRQKPDDLDLERKAINLLIGRDQPLRFGASTETRSVVFKMFWLS